MHSIGRRNSLYRQNNNNEAPKVWIFNYKIAEFSIVGIFVCFIIADNWKLKHRTTDLYTLIYGTMLYIILTQNLVVDLLKYCWLISLQVRHVCDIKCLFASVSKFRIVFTCIYVSV